MRFKVYPTPRKFHAAAVVLVVDVLRATTTATALFERGLRTLILADSLGTAQKLRQNDELLVGEAGGLQLEAFDFSNSPLEVRREDFCDKTAVLTTSNGTRAAHLAAKSSDKVLLACLNNATAACQLASRMGGEVAILCAGSAGEGSLDDTYTAGALAARLLGLGLTPEGDDAREALTLYHANPDPLPVLAQAGAYLKRIGCGDDITACAQLDVSDKVGVMHAKRGTGLVFTAR